MAVPDLPKRRRARPSPTDPAEAYRVMRTNLLVALQDIDRPIVLFTSARPSEGKTSTVGNLAPLLALAGHRVIVADFDLRNPDVHNSFRLPNDAGTADVLRGEAPLEDCMQYVQVQSAGAGGEPERGLYVLTAGAATGDAAELIGSERTPRLLDVLAEQADIVLIDSPPVIGFADSLILGRLATGVILVVEARKTPVPVVLEAKDALIRNQARILGVVISKMEPRDAAQLEGYNYGSSYSFAHAERL